MKLWLIDYENAHFCGGQLNVVVEAETAEVAECLASDHMQEEQRELFADEYEDAENSDEGSYADDEPAYTINSVEEFDESHDQWKFYIDPSQESFYPVIRP